MSDKRGVLFDVDGTLVDTTYIHTVTWWQAIRQAGFDATMAVIHRSVGMGSEKLVERVLGKEALDQVDALADSHKALYAAYWPALRLLPGARELVVRCHEAGLVTVLASSASEQELTVLKQVLNADEYVDESTSSDDASSSKPDADIVQAALKKAQLDTDRAIFVGDAVWDVEASAKAGLTCIGLESGGTSAAELRDAGAVAVYRDPADLLAAFDESPLASS